MTDTLKLRMGELDTGSGLPEDEYLEDVGDIDGAGFSDPAIEIL